MSMQMMQVRTTTLPSFAAAAEMTNNLGATKAGDGVLSRLDGSDAVAGKVKGQNGADGDNDDVVVKVGLKFGKQSVLWGGNCSEFLSLFFFFPLLFLISLPPNTKKPHKFDLSFSPMTPYVRPGPGFFR